MEITVQDSVDEVRGRFNTQCFTAAKQKILLLYKVCYIEFFVVKSTFPKEL